MALSGKSKQKTSLKYSPIAEMDEGTASRDGRRSSTTKHTNGFYIQERQKTKTDMKSSGLGSKQASLYLSRTASLVRTGQESGRTTPNKDEVSSKSGEIQSVSGSKKTSVSSMQREFTFTGYDIMADSTYLQKCI